jgi:hypothetical protein
MKFTFFRRGMKEKLRKAEKEEEKKSRSSVRDTLGCGETFSSSLTRVSRRAAKKNCFRVFRNKTPLGSRTSCQTLHDLYQPANTRRLYAGHFAGTLTLRDEKKNCAEAFFGCVEGKSTRGAHESSRKAHEMKESVRGMAVGDYMVKLMRVEVKLLKARAKS